MTDDLHVFGNVDRLPVACSLYTATCAFVFAIFYSAYSPFSLFAIPFGAILGYIAAYLRQRFTTPRYSFATIPKSKRTHVLTYVSAIASTLAIWHIATGNWMGLWSVIAMGGLAILMISSDFGYLTPQLDGRDNCE
ncbi:hypothetical protein CA13_09330 [Planctomycetes bacterium CA13]|uniref:Uncharacterized protein n=2 Tax=Novipirellula herctigrandis TaxID=2527986 RepID=A0A5C5YWV8_9BACT|nr:hypothetical protein CA13_09330 [Planctomycetes bacterium CA13]